MPRMVAMVDVPVLVAARHVAETWPNVADMLLHLFPGPEK
jgi:hypothetical protein